MIKIFWFIVFIVSGYFLYKKEFASKDKLIIKTKVLRPSELQVKHDQSKSQDTSKEQIAQRYIAGTCLSDNDNWTFSKITAVKDGAYEVVDCHKFKGCGKPVTVKWLVFEHEYRNGKITSCPN